MVSIHETLYPVEDLIPMIACCCMITSCYFGKGCSTCSCIKETHETEKGKLLPSVNVNCCKCIPNCSCPCYHFKCCGCDTSCLRVQVNHKMFYSISIKCV